MSYTLTLESELKIIKSDTIQVKITFIVNDSGDSSNVSYTFQEKRIKILDLGQLKWSYDLEDTLLVPGEIKIKLGDLGGYLDSLFFDNSDVDKRPYFVILQNGNIKFLGNIIEDTISSHYAKKEIEFSVSSNLDILNKTALYDTDESAEEENLNPLNYTDYTFIPFTQLITDIYKVVNPSITYPSSIKINQNWLFEGVKESSSVYGFDGYIVIKDLVFNELNVQSHDVFFNSSNGLKNLADLIKSSAIDFGCFTGMLNNENAFFTRLFYYNSSNIQAIPTPLDYKKNYKYGLIDFVRIKGKKFSDTLSVIDCTFESGTYTNVEDRCLEKQLYICTSGVLAPYTLTPMINLQGIREVDNVHFVFCISQEYSAAVGDIYSTNGSNFQISEIRTDGLDGGYFYYTTRVSGNNNPIQYPTGGTLVKVSGVGPANIPYLGYETLNGIYSISFVKDSTVYSEFLHNGDLISKFWFKYRNKIENCRIDWFKFSGINFDYLKNFTYNSKKYQIISMNVDFNEYTTEIEALYLGV